MSGVDGVHPETFGEPFEQVSTPSAGVVEPCSGQSTICLRDLICPYHHIRQGGAGWGYRGEELGGCFFLNGWQDPIQRLVGPNSQQHGSHEKSHCSRSGDLGSGK